MFKYTCFVGFLQLQTLKNICQVHFISIAVYKIIKIILFCNNKFSLTPFIHSCSGYKSWYLDIQVLVYNYTFVVLHYEISELLFSSLHLCRTKSTANNSNIYLILVVRAVFTVINLQIWLFIAIILLFHYNFIIQGFYFLYWLLCLGKQFGDISVIFR